MSARSYLLFRMRMCIKLQPEKVMSDLQIFSGLIYHPAVFSKTVSKLSEYVHNMVYGVSQSFYNRKR